MNGWLEVDDECQWYGVKCDDEDKNNIITGLNLSNNGLINGTIHTELFY